MIHANSSVIGIASSIALLAGLIGLGIVLRRKRRHTIHLHRLLQSDQIRAFTTEEVGEALGISPKQAQRFIDNLPESDQRYLYVYPGLIRYWGYGWTYETFYRKLGEAILSALEANPQAGPCIDTRLALELHNPKADIRAALDQLPQSPDYAVTKDPQKYTITGHYPVKKNR